MGNRYLQVGVLFSMVANNDNNSYNNNNNDDDDNDDDRIVFDVLC